MNKTNNLVFERRVLLFGSFFLLGVLPFVPDNSRAFDTISLAATTMSGGVLGLLRSEVEQKEEQPVIVQQPQVDTIPNSGQFYSEEQYDDTDFSLYK